MMSGKKSSSNQEGVSKRTASETDAPDVKIDDLCHDQGFFFGIWPLTRGPFSPNSGEILA